MSFIFFSFLQKVPILATFTTMSCTSIFFTTFVKKKNMNIILIQYQPTIALGLLKGKMGGTVFQSGNNSSIIRNKGYRKGTPSASRSLATARIASLASQWRLLSPADIATWKTASLLWAFTNKFGVTYYGSAYQCFMAYNSWNKIVNNNFSYHAGPPASAVNEAPWQILSLSSSTLSIGWNADPIIPQYAILYATDSISPGRNLNNAKFKFIAVFYMTGNTSADLWANYANVYQPPLHGQQIIFKTLSFNPDYPFPYFPSIFGGIVA